MNTNLKRSQLHESEELWVNMCKNKKLLISIITGNSVIIEIKTFYKMVPFEKEDNRSEKLEQRHVIRISGKKKKFDVNWWNFKCEKKFLSHTNVESNSDNEF